MRVEVLTAVNIKLLGIDSQKLSYLLQNYRGTGIAQSV
jgi:hypothetical protein